MAGPTILIFHRPASAGEPALEQLLADVRRRLAEHQAVLFERAGAGKVLLSEARASSFGELLRSHAPSGGGVVVLGSGALPRLNIADARRLVDVAGSAAGLALTNNRYSSDVCAVGDAGVLAELPPLPSDNALPRWLEERAGFEVRELRGRQRLALDIDTPLDIGLWALCPGAPVWVRELVAAHELSVPRLAELRRLAADPHAELLLFGRTGSATMRWLERNVRCRVRLLAEERGLRASSPLAIGGGAPTGATPRPPRATLGLLLEQDGPAALAAFVGDLPHGAVLDSRVLIAHRFGADEHGWPSPADRYASDLLRADEVADGWLRQLTESAANSDRPIVLGAHSLVGPGVPLVLG
jgi:CTP:molybdopterin cytidylyltransferase MocA